jgi:hypothetical protein
MIGWVVGLNIKIIKRDINIKIGSYTIIKIINIINIWGLSIILSIVPYHAFTKALLDDRQFQCLKELWQKESRWDPASISATQDYGIPQRNMSKASHETKAQFLENPYAQILWGLEYIKHRYQTPCHAWSHSKRRGWY